jgi:hypothetical protein
MKTHNRLQAGPHWNRSNFASWVLGADRPVIEQVLHFSIEAMQEGACSTLHDQTALPKILI